MGRKGFPEKDMNAALERLRRTYARMDQAIADSGGPWLLGKQPTLADVAVMPALVRMADLGLATMWQDLPRVQRWFEEIRAHPAFKPTYYFGSLLTERFPHLEASDQSVGWVAQAFTPAGYARPNIPRGECWVSGTRPNLRILTHHRLGPASRQIFLRRHRLALDRRAR